MCSEVIGGKKELTLPCWIWNAVCETGRGNGVYVVVVAEEIVRARIDLWRRSASWKGLDV